MVGARIINKKKTKGLPFPKPLAFVLFIAAVLALSYLWLCERCDAIARNVKVLDQKEDRLHRSVLTEEYKWSTMRSERRIRESLTRFGLQMDWPDNRSVILLTRDFDPEKSAFDLTLPSARQYAQSRDRGREVHD